jgi:hypothetical protein
MTADFRFWPKADIWRISEIGIFLFTVARWQLREGWTPVIMLAPL